MDNRGATGWAGVHPWGLPVDGALHKNDILILATHSELTVAMWAMDRPRAR